MHNFIIYLLIIMETWTHEHSVEESLRPLTAVTVVIIN